jgi:hypothetical protein
VTPLRNIHVRINDAATGRPTGVRIHFVGPDGRYYAPHGHLDNFTVANSDTEGNLLLAGREFACISGTCEIQLPQEPISVEVHKGFEYRPLHRELTLGTGQMAVRLEIERAHDLRGEHWYSGDICCYRPSPHAALLEAAAEDLAVINLLAYVTAEQGPEGEAYAGISNLLAFSGQAPALAMPDHLLVVNTLNTHPVLGALALLNCHRIVYPLSMGGRATPHTHQTPGETNWTLADWCDQCHRKGGLVVWTNAPGLTDSETEPGTAGETLADLILGKVDAYEADPTMLEEWYDLLNAGFRVPLVAGSRKVRCDTNLGNVRTYARLLPEQEFNYKNWIEAVRAGSTFITNGPLLTLSVNGHDPGSVIVLAPGERTIHVRAEARSVHPFERLEIISGTEVLASTVVAQPGLQACIETRLAVPEQGINWLAARCQGAEPLLPGRGGSRQNVAAHTSPIYLQRAGEFPVGDQKALAKLADSLTKLSQWEETRGRFDTEHCRERLGGIIKAALAELNRRRLS